MMQLNPGENFPLVRILLDNQDSNTYYVQTVIRDAVTDTVLATVNLTQVGTRRFRTLFKIPYDNIWNTGRHIIATSTVYTDSGYTTKSDLYYDEVQQYIIAQRWNPSMISVAGTNSVGSAGTVEKIDYEKIKDIVKGEMKALEALEPLEMPEPVDIKPLQDGIALIADKIESIKIPEMDMSPVKDTLKLLSAELKSYHSMQSKDLKPVIERLQGLGTTIGTLDKQHMQIVEQALSRLIDEIVTPLQKENARLKTVLASGFPATTEEMMAEKRKTYLKNLMAKHA